MAEPVEIIAAPLELYTAPVGTAFPDIDEAPGAGWEIVGASGKLNISDNGVTVNHEQDFSEFTPAGATTPRKVWRTKEALTISAELADVSSALYARLLNDATVTTVAAAAGVAGNKSLELFQGDQVETFAVLARGISPADPLMFAQYEVPRSYQAAGAKVTFNKGEPAMLSVEFTALSDDDGDFGVYRVGTAPAS